MRISNVVRPQRADAQPLQQRFGAVRLFMTMRGGTLWAITCYFNPAGYDRRLYNYRRFRNELSVPLAAIELGFNNRWELTENDADKLVRVADGDAMWQKERLLNLLLTHLPSECEYVAWLDSDVLFQDPEWPQQAVEKLTAVPLVQLFSTVRHLARDENSQASVPEFPSIASDMLAGRQACDVLVPVPSRAGEADLPRACPAHGMAWAARRELLERHGLYDRCVIGGGDTAFVCAAYGVPEVASTRWQMNEAQREHYSSWASKFHNDVRGEVDTLSGEILHLWHGDLADRRYSLRQRDLIPHLFNPDSDICPGIDGPWRWASDKPALHSLIRNYFHSRREDGVAQDQVTRTNHSACGTSNSAPFWGDRR